MLRTTTAAGGRVSLDPSGKLGAVSPRPNADGIAVFCAFDDLVPLESVVPNPRNPNTHPDAQLELLAKIIDGQGWRAPITVSARSGFVVRGHGRLAAARLLGKAVVPIDRQEYADEASEYADLIADNRIAELAEMDLLTLKDLLEQIDDGSFDMDLTGFDTDALERMMTASFDDVDVVEDTPPDPPAEPITQPGDLWLLGDHRLLCGDSTDPENFDLLLDGTGLDAIITDPPYGVDYVAQKVKTNPKYFHDRTEIANDNLAGAELQTLVHAVLELAFERANQGAGIYVFHSDAKRVEFENAFRAAGWHLHQVLIWVKQQFVLSMLDYHPQHEPMLYGWKQGGQHNWCGARNRASVFDEDVDPTTLKKADLLRLLLEINSASAIIREDRPTRSAEHPTMKPVRLIARLMANSTRSKDVVLDPFLGSGTTLIAAEQLGRACYGFELDPTYCDVIVERWEALTGRTAERATTRV